MIGRLRHLAIALLLGVLTVTALSIGHRDVGYARDEGIYFEASRRYGRWVSMLVERPGHALKAEVRDKYFGFNHEHPALMKTVAGASARLLAHPPLPTADELAKAAKKKRRVKTDPGGRFSVMPEGAAMRLPAQILAGLGVAILYMAGVAFGGGMLAGLLAAGWFILLPRVAFHAGLHAFDVPVTVAGLAVALAYRRGLRSWQWGLAAGPILGIAIAVKHNALFLGPVLALHYYAALCWGRFRDGLPVRRGQLVPLPLLSMATIGPLVALSLWPWLWTDPVTRLQDYLAFHRQHNWYNMEFLGTNFNQPPMPTSYPAVMTLATVPTVLLVLALAGLLLSLRADLRRGRPAERGAMPRQTAGRFAVPLPEPWSRLDSVWLLLLGTFPLVLISLPSTPIFGGTKHWLTAYPFFALAAAVTWGAVWPRVGLSRAQRRVLAPVVLALVLGPGAVATVRGHPHNLSQYAPMVGGPRGAARLGLNRGFWGYAIADTLRDLPRGSVFLHDLHGLAMRQYEREGRWPKGAKPSSASRAGAGYMFYEKHMLADELPVWERMGTAPARVIELHDVPITAVYQR